MAKRGRPYNPDAVRHHPLRRTHSSMRQRCNNPKNPSYKNYGGRGIKVCKRWDSSYAGFWNFVNDMQMKPTATHTLDRKDNNKGYCKSNCRWATRDEQVSNKRTNRIDGLSVRAVAHAVGVNPHTVYARLNSGLTLSQALNTTPLKHGPPPQRVYIIDGITASIGAHAKRIGVVTEHLAHYRLSRGWAPVDAVKQEKMGRPTRYNK